MKTALFTNFTDEEFTGWWDGKSKTFTPGQTMYMPDYLARHFAKHLANRELLRKDKNGNPIVKDGEKYTSPKRPEDVPEFMKLFNKAYTPDEEESVGNKEDDIDTLINVANKNKNKSKVEKSSELVTPVDLDDDEDDSEEFGAQPVDDEADQAPQADTEPAPNTN